MRHTLPLILLILVITGCETHVTPLPIDRSIEGGLVKLSYRHGQHEQPIVDMASAAIEARDLCRSKGYRHAQELDRGVRVCTTSNHAQCKRYRIDVSYQCQF